jgi:hypothetical protein
VAKIPAEKERRERRKRRSARQKRSARQNEFFLLLHPFILREITTEMRAERLRGKKNKKERQRTSQETTKREGE